MKILASVRFHKEVVIDMDGADTFFITSLDGDDVGALTGDEVGVYIVSETQRAYFVPWSNVTSCEVRVQ